jgi:hypothetical protein
MKMIDVGYNVKVKYWVSRTNVKVEYWVSRTNV